MKKIDRLENIIIIEPYLAGQYFNNEIQMLEDTFAEQSSSRLPNNEEIINKINEIIDYLNKEEETE